MILKLIAYWNPKEIKICLSISKLTTSAEFCINIKCEDIKNSWVDQGIKGIWLNFYCCCICVLTDRFVKITIWVNFRMADEGYVIYVPENGCEIIEQCWNKKHIITQLINQ